MSEILSVSIEDYLETIFIISREQQVARSKDISEHLKVKQSSVTGMLQTLRDRGFVNYEPYGLITLTPKGTTAAKRVLRRHVALRDFMVNILSVDAEAADEAACRMEHGISKPIVDRLIEFADFAQTCPRAGEDWIRNFADRCDQVSSESVNCEACIEQCLADVRAAPLKRG